MANSSQSGIHYDAIALSPSPDAPEEFDQTSFEGSEGERVLEAGLKLAAIWKKKRKFTDLARFQLKCGICKKVSCDGNRSQSRAAFARWFVLTDVALLCG